MQAGGRLKVGVAQQIVHAGGDIEVFHQVLAEQSFQKRKADRGILPMQAEIRFFTAEAVRNDSTISFDVVREDSYFIALTRLPSRDLYLAAVLPCKVPF